MLAMILTNSSFLNPTSNFAYYYSNSNTKYQHTSADMQAISKIQKQNWLIYNHNGWIFSGILIFSAHFIFNL